MTSSRCHGNVGVRRACPAMAAAFLLVLLQGSAGAQTSDDRGGFTVRELSLSSAYASVQPPPITLGGNLPPDILDVDLLTTGTAAIDWRRVTPRTRYLFELFGAYTAHTQYRQLSAPYGTLTFAASRWLGRRWRLDAGVGSVMASSDELMAPPTQAHRLARDARSFDDLSATVALARSPGPDRAHAALFLPITSSLVTSDVYGSRSLVSNTKAGATYRHSLRLATFVRAGYTSSRPIWSNGDPARMLRSPESRAASGGIGVSYDRSERTQLTVALDWSQTSGVSVDKVLIATVGQSWSGRKWFSAATLGAGIPFQIRSAAEPSTAVASRTPELVYRGTIGYKFGAHTLLAQYSRAAHDEYGHGGRNVVTGFEGNVQSAVGAWFWSTPGSAWLARADLSVVRRPGNFSYIYAWLSTAGVGRQIRPSIRLMGELVFDRHGSRAFEGFHMMREAVRVTVIWTAPRRPAE